MLDLIWFEYRCTESHDSADAQQWYRSHQLVRLIAWSPSEDTGCTPDTYTAVWADGFVGDIWADELCPNGPSDFAHPAPPSPLDLSTNID